MVVFVIILVGIAAGFMAAASEDPALSKAIFYVR